MECLSYLSSLFKAPIAPKQGEIEEHLHRLNVLILAYHDARTLADWTELHKETELEWQWFDIHHLQLTSTFHLIQTISGGPPEAYDLRNRFLLPQSESVLS